MFGALPLWVVLLAGCGGDRAQCDSDEQVLAGSGAGQLTLAPDEGSYFVRQDLATQHLDQKVGDTVDLRIVVRVTVDLWRLDVEHRNGTRPVFHIAIHVINLHPIAYLEWTVHQHGQRTENIA